MPDAEILVAEGDSWFAYPVGYRRRSRPPPTIGGTDVLYELEKLGYDVRSSASPGHTIYSMAFDDSEYSKLHGHLAAVAAANGMPRAVLLSGGGNDIAGTELEALLRHARDGDDSLDNGTVSAIIDGRLDRAYRVLVGKIGDSCCDLFGDDFIIPILIHGYAYAVPDGRPANIGALPDLLKPLRKLFGMAKIEMFGIEGRGPWLKPAFELQGYHNNLRENTRTIEKLIRRFNAMTRQLAGRYDNAHVYYVDVRGQLKNDLRNDIYKKNNWENELHPSPAGFARIARVFHQAIIELPTPPRQVNRSRGE